MLPSSAVGSCTSKEEFSTHLQVFLLLLFSVADEMVWPASSLGDQVKWRRRKRNKDLMLKSKSGWHSALLLLSLTLCLAPQGTQGDDRSIRLESPLAHHRSLSLAVTAVWAPYRNGLKTNRRILWVCSVTER